ncbi:hypothetical protein [Chondrinema litorale]|uniref:hypothetical protein n=1 Tax=Chondrinema litorale TaxID=2994555 RepID=UPI0025431120|nr:hypothetical protein [Chondrinema litorale]UZR93978.1 hypothetical protein OQ292_19215 [Chondrinema litorale]
MKIVKALWIFSFLGCFGVIVLTYAHLPLTVSIGEVESDALVISKDAYFYYSTGILLLFNILLNIIGKVIQYVPTQGIIIPNKKLWLTNINTIKELFFLVKSWVRGLAFISNLFLSVVIGIVYDMNSRGHFVLGWVLYIIAGLAIFWITYFFVLFLSKPSHLKKEFS